MACLRFRPIVAAMVASSLIVSSTGAVAATMTPASAVPQQVNPWATLSALSAGAPAAALCGGTAATAAASAAATAAQGPAPGCVLPVVDQVAAVPVPTPVPAVEPVGGGFGISPLVLALGALAAAALIYFLVRNNDDDDEVSPT